VSEPVLACRGLVRRFGERTAVDDVSFEIAAGETYGLLGPNGSGKTTTISMIAGVLAPDARAVHVAGLPMTTSASPAKAAIGPLPQSLALFLGLTTRGKLRFFGRLFVLPRDVWQARVDRLRAITRLAPFVDRRADALSGGMYKKLALACALLHEPPVLLLDEPTNGVDPVSRRGAGVSRMRASSSATPAASWYCSLPSSDAKYGCGSRSSTDAIAASRSISACSLPPTLSLK